ncbi:MAG: hypothetical protein SGBAC_003952 [Bacillariaceae sp.]
MSLSLPEEIPVPAVIAIGLIGFLIAISAILHSKSKQGKVKVAFDTPSTSSDAPSTPTQSPQEGTATPTDKKTGSIQTPAGRRSARLAKRRKED